MFQRKPLIDAVWLLGPDTPEPMVTEKNSSRSSRWSPWIATALIAGTGCVAWQYLTTAMLDNMATTPSPTKQISAIPDPQLNEHDPQILAVQHLVKNLPDTVPELLTVVATHPNKQCSQLAYGALAEHLHQVGVSGNSIGDMDLCLEQMTLPNSVYNAQLIKDLLRDRISSLQRDGAAIASADRDRLLGKYNRLLGIEPAAASPAVAFRQTTPPAVSNHIVTAMPAPANDEGSATINFRARATSDATDMLERHAKSSQQLDLKIAELDSRNLRVVDREPVSAKLASTRRVTTNSLRTTDRLTFRLPTIEELMVISNEITVEPDTAALMTTTLPPMPDELLTPAIKTIASTQAATANVTTSSTMDSSAVVPTRVIPYEATRTPESIQTVSYRSTEPDDVEDHANAKPFTGQTASIGEDQTPADLSGASRSELLRMLGSVQPKIAGGAMCELQKQGWTEDQLKMAVSLMVGTPASRMKATDRLVEEQKYQPLPWLVLLAEDPDLEVRENAIRVLGSIPTDESRRHLRLLLNRETNANMRTLLRQLCMASGTTASVTR